METNKILTADILDIIFDGRNKQYGAYELRVSYNSRIKKALLLTGSFLLLIFLTSVFASMGKKPDLGYISTTDMEMAALKPDIPLPPPPIVKPVPALPVNQIQYTTPIIVDAKKFIDIDPIEEIPEGAAISSYTIKTDNNSPLLQAPIDVQESNVIETPKEVDSKKVFIKVEQEAEFPGGISELSRYLQRTMEGFSAGENGAAPGKYQVIVRFIVSKDGSISDVQALTNFGYGLEELAVKSIKEGPKWIPALQNGQHVNAYRSQPVTFVVNE